MTDFLGGLGFGGWLSWVSVLINGPHIPTWIAAAMQLFFGLLLLAAILMRRNERGEP